MKHTKWVKALLITLILEATNAPCSTIINVPVTATAHPVMSIPMSPIISYLVYPQISGRGWAGLGMMTDISTLTSFEINALMPSDRDFKFGMLIGLKHHFSRRLGFINFAEGTFTRLLQNSRSLKSIGIQIGWDYKLDNSKLEFAVGIEGLERVSALTAGSKISDFHSLRSSLALIF